MKRFLLILGGLFFALSLQSCNKETILTQDQVPATIKNYVTQHFPEHTILQSVEDKDGFTLTYEIILSDGFKLEFNRKKEIIEVSGKPSKLPESVVPTSIQNYVTNNYGTNFIVKWEQTSKNKQQIELDNNLELIFDNSGKFLKLD